MEESTEMILGSGKEIKIKGKRVGHLDNYIFTAERLAKNKFRLYDGWGLSRQLIYELVTVSGKKILWRIYKKKPFNSTNLLYTLEVTPINWQSRGIAYFNPTLKEDQLILPETSFDRKIIPSVRVIR